MKNCAHVPFSLCIPTINYVGWRVEVVENKEFPYNTLFWRLVPLFTDKESRYDSKQLIVNISKKVASDFMDGSNGWANAVAYKQMLENGRSVN